MIQCSCCCSTVPESQQSPRNTPYLFKKFSVGATEGLTESLSEDQERIRTLEERIHQLEGSNRELGARNSKLQLELSRAKHRLVQVPLAL